MMSDDDKQDYNTFKEKIIDIEIEFNPSSKYCVENSMKTKYKFTENLSKNIQKLDIKNIRIIKKIEKLAKTFYVYSSGMEDKVMSQISHTLCLYTLCYYNSDPNIPDYKYVKRKGFDFLEKNEGGEENKQKIIWDAFLRNYQYTHTDTFDSIIAMAVESGYIDKEKFLEEAYKLNENNISDRSCADFNDTWSLYNNTLSNNEDEIIREFEIRFKKNIDYLNINHLNSTVVLFRELEKNEQANNMINIFIEKKISNPKIFNIESYRYP
jgi:hypothetical protein